MVIQEGGESPPSTRKSRPSLNDDPSLCAYVKLLVVLASSIGGDRLLWNRFAVQTTAPSGLGKSESGW